MLKPSLCLLGLLVLGCSSAPKVGTLNNAATLRRHVKDWPVSSRFAVEEMVEKYGLPASVTKDEIVWNNTGYFKRSKVYRVPVPHNFPTPHEDVLEQTIGYRIPASAVDDLWQFNGSLLVDRTRGELSSRCQREEMNVLALNLADNVIQNRMTVAKARKEYDSSTHQFVNGDVNATYMAGLNFSEYLNAGDPDHGYGQKSPGTRQAQEDHSEE